jgi:hypothetical protein
VGYRIRDDLLAGQIVLKFQVDVPAEIPEIVTGHNKANEEVPLKLRESYPYYYQLGWEECLRSFIQIRRGDRMDPFDQSNGPGMKQICGHYSNYELLGWKDCRTQLAEHSSKYGVSTVRRVLRKSYGDYMSNIEKIHPEMAKFRPIADDSESETE